ncbi:MAG TPA: hypothetical protein VGO64_01785 [Candidatus Limnocylindrales bacterium]|jgi:hypothetical protein|nr:hypothetical protein [Candidatus Limnocylindrales bacterium]
MVIRIVVGESRRMKKRALATVLWFYSGWYAGALLAQVVGLSPVLGLIIGTAAAAIVGVDPRGFIWTQTTRPSAKQAPRGHSATAAPSI